MHRYTYIVFGLILVSAGCRVGPNYHRTESHTPEKFVAQPKNISTNASVTEWWKEFHDDELNRLIERTMRQNLDLQMAAVRIRQARFQRSIAAADLFPRADANGSYTRSHGSKNVELPLGGGGSGGNSSQSFQSKGTASTTQESEEPAGSPPSPFGKGGLPGVTTDLYQVGFDASWEFDVFGGKRRQIEAASAEIEAADEGRRNLQVSLTAEVARNYFDLRGAQRRLQIARKILANQKTLVTLVRSKQSVGLASETDVARAAARESSLASAIPPLEGQIGRLSHVLAILAGLEPDELTKELGGRKPLPPLPPEVPIGLPSELLERRPDIRRAEREMAVASARIGVAQAELFPKFALIGSAGLDSTKPENLFNWQSRYFLISPTVTWRIFDAGRIGADIRLQKATAEESGLRYRSTILRALEEVEDALVMYATEQAKHVHLTEALKQNHEELKLAQNRYQTGLTDYLMVLEAEEKTSNGENILAESDATLATDLVAIYKALGGGWEK